MTNVDGVRLRDLLVTLSAQLSLGVSEALEQAPAGVKVFIPNQAVVVLRISVVGTEPFRVSLFNAYAANRYHVSEQAKLEAHFRLRPRLG